MCHPAVMLAAMAVQTGIGVVGALQQGHAEAQAANYNASITAQNAQQARRNSEMASQSGMAEQEAQGIKNRQQAGSIKANQGASGVGVNSGSFADVSESQDMIGTLDAHNIRTRAVREAYGHEVQAIDFDNRATIERQEAKNAKTASYFKAADTLLGGISQAGSKYTEYKKQGAFSSGQTPQYPRTLGGA